MLEHLRKTDGQGLQLNNLGVDFGPIHAAIQQEGALLHPSMEAMQESFAAGLAVAHTEDVDGRQVAVGYSRLIPLLGEEQIQELGLPAEFPLLAELGTVFVSPQYRGHGMAEGLYRELFGRFRESMQGGRLLVIGTTKTAKVLHQLEKLRDMGINVHAGRHTEFPNLAPVTCVCNPDFGSGFQHGPDCSERVTESDAQRIREALPGRGVIMLRDVSNGDPSKIPCTMFVSDRALAASADRMISETYGMPTAQQIFVDRLGGINYYA